jgi:hypothetical protein
MSQIHVLPKQRGMEEAPENGKELSHSAHANGMNEVCMLSSEYNLGTAQYLGFFFFFVKILLF